MGHTVCHDDSTPIFPDNSSIPFYLLPYTGEDSWSPLDWNNSTVTLQTAIVEHPAHQNGMWNEVVMKSLTNHEEYSRAVQAFFYVPEGGKVDIEKDRNRKKAFQQAKSLGGKPVLRWNETNDFLFECDTGQSGLHSGEGMPFSWAPAASDRAQRIPQTSAFELSLIHI